MSVESERYASGDFSEYPEGVNVDEDRRFLRRLAVRALLGAEAGDKVLYVGRDVSSAVFALNAVKQRLELGDIISGGTRMKFRSGGSLDVVSCDLMGRELIGRRDYSWIYVDPYRCGYIDSYTLDLLTANYMDRVISFELVSRGEVDPRAEVFVDGVLSGDFSARKWRDRSDPLIAVELAALFFLAMYQYRVVGIVQSFWCLCALELTLMSVGEDVNHSDVYDMGREIAQSVQVLFPIGLVSPKITVQSDGMLGGMFYTLLRNQAVTEELSQDLTNDLRKAIERRYKLWISGGNVVERLLR